MIDANQAALDARTKAQNGLQSPDRFNREYVIRSVINDALNAGTAARLAESIEALMHSPTADNAALLADVMARCAGDYAYRVAEHTNNGGAIGRPMNIGNLG